MSIERVSITLSDGRAHHVSGENVGRRATTLINLFELQAAAESQGYVAAPVDSLVADTYRQSDLAVRCSGDCSYGGEGPSCNLPGCRG